MTERNLILKTYAIIMRGRFNREENDYEATRVKAYSEDHACHLASEKGIEYKMIAQVINVDSGRYQQFVATHKM